MNTSDSSPSSDEYGGVARQPGVDAVQLFDDLFDDNAERLQVKKPARTYGASKRRPLLNIHNRLLKRREFNEDNDDDTDGGGGDDDIRASPTKKKKTKGKKRNPPKKKKEKKAKAPALSIADAVLAAYNKAIEMNELPDFDEIDKQELNVRVVCADSPPTSQEASTPSFYDQNVNLELNSLDELLAWPQSTKRVSNAAAKETAEEDTGGSTFDNENTPGTTLMNLNRFNLDQTPNILTSTPHPLNSTPQKKKEKKQKRSCLRNIGNLTPNHQAAPVEPNRRVTRSRGNGKK